MKPQVRVVWDDAEDPAKAWMSERAVKKFAGESCLAVSIGFVADDNKQYLTLAGDWIEKLKTYGRVTKIPKTAIQSIEPLEVRGSP